MTEMKEIHYGTKKLSTAEFFEFFSSQKKMKTFVNNFNQLPEVVLRKWLNRLIHFWFAKLLLFARLGYLTIKSKRNWV